MIDYTLFEFFNGTFHNSFFDSIIPFITDSENVKYGTILLLFIYLVVQRKKEALILVIGALIAFALADSIAYRILKPFFGRARPANPAYFLDGVNQFLTSARFIMGTKDTLSLPSNHAANMFTFGIYFSLFYPKWTKVLMPLAIFITYTRLYVGVHYPLDLCLGAVLGSAMAIPLYLLVKRIPMICKSDLFDF